MSLEQLFSQMGIARQCGGDETVVLRRFIRSRSKLPRPRQTMVAFNFGRRTELTELRPRHLVMVEEYGIADHYNRDDLWDYFLANWNRLFGTLRRSKALDVPGDLGRKERMISRLLNLIEMRRADYADERAARWAKSSVAQRRF